jgi:hypothetical protein
MIAIGAMTLFMNLGWESFGGIGIIFISLLYGSVGLKLTNVFKSKGLAIPAVMINGGDYSRELRKLVSMNSCI